MFNSCITTDIMPESDQGVNMIAFCEVCDRRFNKKSSEKECCVKCRFLNRLEIKDSCWTWKGNFHPKSGYGLIRDGNKTKLAHRLSYELFIGEIERGKCVCHSCDNRLCVNPKHLWIGSQGDNIDDMKMKGRNTKAKGESSGTSRLKEKDVLEIRHMVTLGKSPKIIMELFNISRSTVYDIKRRKIWKHI